MYSAQTAVTSPHIDCYEECVVTDEIYLPPESSAESPPPACSVESSSSSSSSSSDCVASQHGVPRAKSSGRVTKRSRGKSRSYKDKKCSSPLVLQWLDDNYEIVPGACLPRSVLYTHYQDFCKRNHVEPSSAASFGKIIRMKFPNLSTRRLGTRGQSKYHYYGLAIQESSMYYRSTYSKKGLTRFSGASLKRENGQLYSPSSKTGLLLPDFPKTEDLNFEKPFPVERVDTFLMMYRAHCQRILDSVVRANFNEVENFLVHFWQGMPNHMQPILGCQSTVDLIVVCDFILYRTLSEVLVPATLQPLQDKLVEDIKAFSHNIVEWLFAALQDLPAALGIRKVQTAEMFGKSLRRQVDLIHLAKGARAVLRTSESVTGVLNDWQTVSLESGQQQEVEGEEQQSELFIEFAGEMEKLFVKQSSLEVYFEWLDSLIDKRVHEPSQTGVSLVDLSQDFIMAWNSFNHILAKQLSTGTNFDSYHAVQLVLDEYVSYVLEMLQSQLIESQYNDVLKVQGRGESSSSPSFTLPPLPTLPTLPTGTAALHHSVFPPTPDLTPVTGPPHHPHHPHHQDFFSPFETRITTVFQEADTYITSALQSPSLNTLTDTFCNSFFKHEMSSYHKPSCSMVQNLPLTENPPVTIMDTSPKALTPQSSHYSSSSPLSHQSPLTSPEPSFDEMYSGPQGSIPAGSPQTGDLPSVMDGHGMYSTSSHQASVSNSACTSPLSHNINLGIAASLELIEGVDPSMGASGYEYVRQASSHSAATSPYADGYPQLGHHHTPPPTYSSGAGNYNQYDFELLRLMSDPDDLLVDPFSSSSAREKTASLICSPATPSTPVPLK